MIYTALFAHLESRPIFNVGDKISEGVQIGRMGDTGHSFLAHIHLAVAEGEQKEIFTLEDLETGRIKSAPRELNYFIDVGLFNYDVKVTVPYCDYKYQLEYGKVHHAYDVSTTKSWPWSFFWNRSFKGWVTFNGFDDAYGNTIMIGYEK